MADDSTITRRRTTNLDRDELPFKNLAVTGFLGVGKSTVSIRIANQLGVSLFDIDDEIELRELMSISKIREQYGDSRLKKLENDLCREAALMRRSIIVLPGAALLDMRNYRLIDETATIVCLTCEIGEALRRLHGKNPARYRDKTSRGRMIGRIRRESQIVNDERILQLDTTHMPVQEQADLIINLWRTGEVDEEVFRYGPAEPIKPPPRTFGGVSERYTVEKPTAP
jgi:shikimate kinase